MADLPSLFPEQYESHSLQLSLETTKASLREKRQIHFMGRRKNSIEKRLPTSEKAVSIVKNESKSIPK